MFGYMEFFYTRASFGRLLLTIQYFLEMIT
uniref:Uncharacterized protein n=1 Tax=Siphoviridae sp. ctOiG6 TaxID=2826313 RepID=A0A8S5N113_9CAUD|nr:MAG TPA: hypothetical protein [Siphoviridae sp. ctOiG6]